MHGCLSSVYGDKPKWLPISFDYERNRSIIPRFLLPLPMNSILEGVAKMFCDFRGHDTCIIVDDTVVSFSFMLDGNFCMYWKMETAKYAKYRLDARRSQHFPCRK